MYLTTGCRRLVKTMAFLSRAVNREFKLNYLYGRTLFNLIIFISIFLFIYLNINYPQIDDDIPLYLVIVNVLVSLLLIILAVFRCHAIGWSGWRVLAFIVPLANLILLISLMVLATKKPCNDSTGPAKNPADYLF